MAASPDVPIRILIADDHDLFRTGLSSLLAAEPDLELVAQASGGRAAVRLARELSPQVVLMDLRMPDLGGEGATAIVTVVLSVLADEASVAAAIRAGASGYLVKDSSIEEIGSAIRAADQSALQALTARELDVLRLLARGLENAEIAAELQISSRTAKNHVSSILTKLELHNRVQAAVFAVHHRLD